MFPRRKRKIVVDECSTKAESDTVDDAFNDNEDYSNGANAIDELESGVRQLDEFDVCDKRADAEKDDADDNNNNKSGGFRG